MSVTGAVSTRSRIASLAWRTLVAVGGTVLAGLSFASAVAHIVRDSNPEAALQFSQHDAIALSGKAEAALASVKPAVLTAPATRQLVLASLRAQALNPRALRQLGFVADARRDTGAAERLIRLAERTSRREFGAQLWLIENGVRSDNMPGTLAHYDTALRSGYDSGSILYPVLTAALDDEEVQRAFGRYIKNPPPWLGIFLTYAIGQGPNPAALARTIIGAGGLPDDSSYRDFERQLLAQLTAKKQFGDARDYYLSLEGADKMLPLQIGFGKAATDAQFAPISWQLQSTPGVGGTLAGDGQGQAQQLSLYAGSGERGTVVRKLLYLPVGRYAISQQTRAQQLSDGASGTWEVKCLSVGDDRLIWRGDFPLSTGARTLPPFVIPSDCSTQSIELIVAGGTSQSGSEAILERVSLSRPAS